VPNSVTVRYGSTGAKKITSEVDQFKAKYESLKKTLDTTTGKGLLTGLAAGAGIAAFNAATGAIEGLAEKGLQSLEQIGTASLNLYRTQEESAAKLTVSLRDNANLMGDTTGIEERIKASEQLGFTDVQLRDSLTLLVAATHDVQKAFDLQKAAMDLARFKNIGLQDATTAITSIEAGRARGLAALGINVKDYSTIEERLTAVEKIAQGQAEDYAKTLNGQTAVGMAKVTDAGEKLGYSLGKVQATVFPPFIAGVADMTGKLADFLNGGQSTVPVIDDLDNRFGKLTGSTLVFTDAERHAIEVSKSFHDAVGSLGQGFADLTGKIDTAGSALSNDLFGGVQNRGKRADLLTQYDDLKKRLAGTHGKERDSLLGQIGAVEQALFDLDLKMAESAGPDALIKFLDQAKLHTEGLTGAEKDLIDSMEAAAKKQKIQQQYSLPDGSVYTGANPLGTHRPPGTPAPVATSNLEPATARRPASTTNNLTIKVNVTGTGLLTPGERANLANQIGPSIARWLLNRGVILSPNSAGARGQALAL
jgi:hypothetical protein